MILSRSAGLRATRCSPSAPVDQVGARPEQAQGLATSRQQVAQVAHQWSGQLAAIAQDLADQAAAAAHAAAVTALEELQDQT